MSQDRSLVILAAVGCATLGGVLVCGLSGALFFFIQRRSEPPPFLPADQEPFVENTELSEPSVILVEHLTIQATVSSFSGAAAVTAGSSCNFDVEHRIFSNNTAQCHVDVVCGTNVHLYGTASNGFFRCEFSRVPPRVVGQDLETTSGDTDGAFVIDTDRRVLEVRDDVSGAFGIFDLRATITSVL